MGARVGARERVLDSALKLFNEHGCNGTSIKMIIDKSGVSNGGVYHHFKTKECIIYDLYAKVKTDMLEFILEHLEEDLSTREMFQAIWKYQIEWSFQNWSEKKFLDYITYSHFIKKLHTEEVVERFERVFSRFFEAMEHGEIRKLDKQYFILDFMGNIGSVIAYLKFHPEHHTDEFINFTFKKYWRSVANI